jgi:hypothetical protein
MKQIRNKHCGKNKNHKSPKMIYTLQSKSFNPQFIIFKERMLTNQSFRYCEEEIATMRGRDITDGTNRTVAGGSGDGNDIDDGAERRGRALREREAESVSFTHLLSFNFDF